MLAKLSGWRRWGLCVALLLLGLEFCFLLDNTLFLLTQGRVKSGQFNATMRALKCWGDAPTLIIVAVGILLAAPKSRWGVACMLGSALLSASIVEGIKPFFGRPRPSETSFIPAGSEAYAINGRNSSFPSGHAATAFAFARALALSHPAVAPVCMTAAVGTALSRIFEQRHFLSDCFAGSVLGWLVATWTCRFGLALRERTEKRRMQASPLPALRIAS